MIRFVCFPVAFEALLTAKGGNRHIPTQLCAGWTSQQLLTINRLVTTGATPHQPTPAFIAMAGWLRSLEGGHVLILKMKNKRR